MIQVAPNIETSTSSNIEQEYSPTEGDIAPKSQDEDEDQETNEEDSDDASIGDYLYELNEGESPQSNLLDFTASQVDSSLPDPESGMKNIAIEFTFEILDTFAYEMELDQNFPRWG